MIETLAVITAVESAQNYSGGHDDRERVFKLEYVSNLEPKSDEKQHPSIRLEELAGSTYAYRESTTLKTVSKQADTTKPVPDGDELLDVIINMMEDRIETYIEGEIVSVDSTTRPHTANLASALIN